jgi:hypothetical protein
LESSVCLLNTFFLLALYNATGSFCIFMVPVLEWVLSSRMSIFDFFLFFCGGGLDI